MLSGLFIHVSLAQRGGGRAPKPDGHHSALGPCPTTIGQPPMLPLDLTRHPQGWPGRRPASGRSHTRVALNKRFVLSGRFGGRLELMVEYKEQFW